MDKEGTKPVVPPSQQTLTQMFPEQDNAVVAAVVSFQEEEKPVLSFEQVTKNQENKYMHMYRVEPGVRYGMLIDDPTYKPSEKDIRVFVPTTEGGRFVQAKYMSLACIPTLKSIIVRNKYLEMDDDFESKLKAYAFSMFPRLAKKEFFVNPTCPIEEFDEDPIEVIESPTQVYRDTKTGEEVDLDDVMVCPHCVNTQYDCLWNQYRKELVDALEDGSLLWKHWSGPLNRNASLSYFRWAMYRAFFSNI